MYTVHWVTHQSKPRVIHLLLIQVYFDATTIISEKNDFKNIRICNTKWHN